LVAVSDLFPFAQSVLPRPYLEQAKQELIEEGYEDLDIERLDFEISKAGIFDALLEGTNAAGGHETALRIWADGEWV